MQVGDPVLRAKALPIPPEKVRSKPVQQLIEWMRETMHDAPGVGLAAPQVGVALQLAVIEDRAESMRDIPPEQLAERERKPVPFQVVINPKIRLRGSEVEFFEGCLSMPGFTAVVPRARMARVDCLNHRGQPVSIHAFGWHARILQHEIDHLKGVVYIDRMRSPSLTTADNFTRHWKHRPVADVIRHLSGRTVSPPPRRKR
ncbi:MAG: peptide deformylase [Bryobacteraceae bacterium]